MPLRQQLSHARSQSAAFEAPMDRVAISYYRAPHNLTLRVRGTQQDATKPRPASRASALHAASTANSSASNIASTETRAPCRARNCSRERVLKDSRTPRREFCSLTELILSKRSQSRGHGASRGLLKAVKNDSAIKMGCCAGKLQFKRIPRQDDKTTKTFVTAREPAPRQVQRRPRIPKRRRMVPFKIKRGRPDWALGSQVALYGRPTK